MRNDLMRAVLDCGIADLELLDDADADMFEIVGQMRTEGMEITLHSIMGEIFREGIWRLGEAVKALKEGLESKEKSGEITEEDSGQLKKLRDHHINPEEDFKFYLNFLGTHLFAAAEKEEVYMELFEKELQALESYTGFHIEW